jgi:hypothetical protein
VTVPIDPIPIGGWNSASRVTSEQLAEYSTWERIPRYLRSEDTKMIYIDPYGNVTHLNGPHAGAEGVSMYQNLQGEQHLPIEQVLTESAYQLGATIERVNILKRIIDFRIFVGRPGMNNLQYRMAEDRWWAGQHESLPGWFGVFTRFSGWRWIQVWPMKTVDTAQKYDATMYGNNAAIWDVQWVAPRPYYSKPARYKAWKASESSEPKIDVDDGRTYYYGTVPVSNAGDMETYVTYLVEGAGFVKVQDNDSNRMVSSPEIFASDGTVMINSDPIERTIIAEHDAHDNLFYKIARSAGLFKFLLGGFGDRGEDIWERKYMRFMFTVPPHSTVSFDVQHTNPFGVITPIVFQRFKRSR